MFVISDKFHPSLIEERHASVSGIVEDWLNRKYIQEMQILKKAKGAKENHLPKREN